MEAPRSVRSSRLGKLVSGSSCGVSGSPYVQETSAPAEKSRHDASDEFEAPARLAWRRFASRLSTHETHETRNAPSSNDEPTNLRVTGLTGLTRERAEDARVSLYDHGRRYLRRQRAHAPRRAGVGDVPAPHQVSAEAERDPRSGASVSVRPHRNRGGAEEAHRRYATPARTSRPALSRTSRT